MTETTKARAVKEPSLIVKDGSEATPQQGSEPGQHQVDQESSSAADQADAGRRGSTGQSRRGPPALPVGDRRHGAAGLAARLVPGPAVTLTLHRSGAAIAAPAAPQGMQG